MSLAITAASFDNDNDGNYNSITKKKQTTSHNKTQRKQYNDGFNTNKVNSVLASIHNKPLDDDDDDDNYNKRPDLQHYEPLSPPKSVGSTERLKHKGTENMATMDERIPGPMENENVDRGTLEENFMNASQREAYYKKMAPNYNAHKNANNKAYYSEVTGSAEQLSDVGNNYANNQVILDKLNFMINLLEEQQDQKTNTVTEEVVLYSFLGVFIIFIVDSFARVGKYKR